MVTLPVLKDRLTIRRRKVKKLSSLLLASMLLASSIPIAVTAQDKQIAPCVVEQDQQVEEEVSHLTYGDLAAIQASEEAATLRVMRQLTLDTNNAVKYIYKKIGVTSVLIPLESASEANSADDNSGEVERGIRERPNKASPVPHKPISLPYLVRLEGQEGAVSFVMELSAPSETSPHITFSDLSGRKNVRLLYDQGVLSNVDLKEDNNKTEEPGSSSLDLKGEALKLPDPWSFSLCLIFRLGYGHYRTVLASPTCGACITALFTIAASRGRASPSASLNARYSCPLCLRTVSARLATGFAECWRSAGGRW